MFYFTFDLDCLISYVTAFKTHEIQSQTTQFFKLYRGSMPPDPLPPQYLAPSALARTQKPAYGPPLLTGSLLLDDSLRFIRYGKTGKHKDHKHNCKTPHKRTHKEQSQDLQHHPQKLKKFSQKTSKSAKSGQQR